MRFREILRRNVETIIKATLAVAGGLFSILSILLSFITWEEMGIVGASKKIVIFLIILLCALVIGILTILLFKRNNLIWENGDGKINICYLDIMKLAFDKKNRAKKIVVIPVNTSFDTIVDENLSLYDKPLVSPTTVHGMWIKNMVKQGFTIQDIDSAIDKYISLRNIEPVKILTPQEKKRGKLNAMRMEQ